MNSFVFMGRLTRDVEKKVYGETTVARCGLAVDRRGRKDAEQTADFFDLVWFGKGADFASNYLTKGQRILVRGHAQTNTYTDNDTGKKRTSVSFVVEDTEFADSKQNGRTAAPATTDAPAEFVKVPDAAVESAGLPFD